ncbi:MAG: TonB family protein [Desulfonatronovibrionaceae bacterium]
MRGFAWLGSVMIHAFALAFLFFGGWQTAGKARMDLARTPYAVELVSLREAQVEKPGTGPEPQKEESVPDPKPLKEDPESKAKAPDPPPRSEPEKRTEKISPRKRKTASAEKKEPEPSAEEKTRSQEREDRGRILDEALSSAREQAEERDRENAVSRALAGVEASLGSDEGGGRSQGGGSADPSAVYVSVVGERIKDNWRFPAVGRNLELAARVRIRVDSKGRIAEQDMVDPSGDQGFDSSVLRAVQETESLPSPPGGEGQTIVVNFNLKNLE